MWSSAAAGLRHHRAWHHLYNLPGSTVPLRGTPVPGEGGPITGGIFCVGDRLLSAGKLCMTPDVTVFYAAILCFLFSSFYPRLYRYPSPGLQQRGLAATGTWVFGPCNSGKNFMVSFQFVKPPMLFDFLPYVYDCHHVLIILHFGTRYQCIYPA